MSVFFLNSFCLTTRMLIFMDEDLAKAIQTIFKKHFNHDYQHMIGKASPETLIYDDPHNPKAINFCDSLILDFAALKDLHTIASLSNPYAVIKNCVQLTNSFVWAVQVLQIQGTSRTQLVSSRTVLDHVHEYLRDKPGFDFTFAKQVTPEKIHFMSGNFQPTEEKGTYLYNGSFGQLQLGIPPETIKGFMKRVSFTINLCCSFL